MKKENKVSVSFAIIGLLAGGASGNVILSFDSGSYDNPGDWSNNSGTISGSHAHDGAFGISDPDWTYSTANTVAVGDTLSAWYRPSNPSEGRFYLGFGADGSGTQSFVLAPNTGDIRFQDNPSYGFTELDTQSFSFSSQWYFVEVTRNSVSSATGRVYDSDGSTLLASLTQTGLTRTAEGVALRSFDGGSIDTVATSTSPIPEPSSILPLLGIIALGFAARRR